MVRILALLVLLLAVACGSLLEPVDVAMGSADVPVAAGMDASTDTDPSIEVQTADASVVQRTTVPNNEPDAGCIPIAHDNGLGQSYWNCAPLGTWNEAAAWAACEAYVAGGTGGSCHLRSGGACAGKAVISWGMLVRDQTNAAWDFGADARGHVSTYPGGSSMGCPTAADPVWN